MPEGQEDIPHLETPTADAADQFLKKRLIGRESGSQDNDTPLSEAVAKEISLKILNDEKEIVRLTTLLQMGETYGRESEFKPLEESSDIIVSKYGDVDNPDVDVTGYTIELGGMGDMMSGNEAVVNYYYSGRLRQELKTDLGIDTPYYFSVSLFTDKKTFTQIKEMRERGEISDEFMYTSYFFDEDGNSKKTISLPVNFPDNRPVLSQDRYYKTIIEDLSSGDYKLAEAAISTLKDKLKKIAP